MPTDQRGGEVSIHAPWEGCDYITDVVGIVWILFQFTHPGKGATVALTAPTDRQVKFQFTHPGKGATKPKLKGISVDSKVSIHAPWEGCDSDERTRARSLVGFQFTHPGKGATLSERA